MTPRNPRRKARDSQVCRLCLSALEQTEDGLICPSCLIVWYGDTFEPLEKDPTDYPSDFYFRYGTGC